MMFFILSFISCALGAVSGIGGGIILKSVLDAFTSFHPANISTLSAFTVFAMAVSASLAYLKSKTPFDKKNALRLSIGAVLGGMLGSRLLGRVMEALGRDGEIKLLQNWILLFLLLVVLFYVNFGREKFQYRIESSLLSLGCGVFLGMVSAFLGIGGGPINMAVLCLFFSTPLREAAVCSVMIILFSQGAKIVTLLLTGDLTGENLPLLAFLIPGAVLGGLAGAILSRRLPKSWILWIYNGVMILVQVICVWNIMHG